MNQLARSLILIALCSTAVACNTTKKVKPSTTNGAESAGSTTDRGAQAGAYTPSDLDSNACLKERVIYFDFDQDSLRPESRSVVDCHAKYLRDRPSARAVLGGHADERGSREYNVGLSERRGNAVSSAFTASGVSGSQVSVVSYGEERPVCAESAENCWSSNRRVEIDYETR